MQEWVIFRQAVFLLMAQAIKILVADDDKNLREVLVGELANNGYGVNGVENGTRALEILKKNEVDVLLLDLSMPDLDGMEVLKRVKAGDLSAEVIILTAHGTVSTAVEAMKLGAYDFLTKPFKMDELCAIVEKAHEKKTLRDENLLLKTRIRRQTETPAIIMQSRIMQDLLKTVDKVSRSDLPVLILGESGTGKELIARAVHQGSHKADSPFIALNCGAIPETMLESELFGHERGAFTGATEKKPGLLEIANQGTLFLDEVGELPAALQVKLLRAIETGKFFRVGGVKEVAVDVRFLSATNKDVKAEAGSGGFRADLYYRISALTLKIPPLRERSEDIPLLIEHFLGTHPQFRNKRFSADAVNALCRYAWPGNVRELQNVIHRTVLLTHEEVILECDLPADIIDCRKPQSSRLADLEREHILRVLSEAGGHRGRAAETLGIDPKTLYRKLLGYGIAVREGGAEPPATSRGNTDGANR